ncbi:MAG: chromosome segregation protein SMC [Terriglobia bacterium]
MLKLREIELLGFKSFADRTHLACEGHTVAVVGPNGCGKSNLADAMSWVLGEQSARMLRGERMLDVIFNGTGTRPPTGMAEASITLVDVEAANEAEAAPSDNVTHPPQESPGTGENGRPRQLASDPGRARIEIKVTRRLFRSGESEYLLNGELCRLRDIQDIFMGTGLGPESYAIIEQGRIGQILSSKPMDRRAIIEEAAGVSKFKSRKRLAEAKLEASRQNLSRIHDILEEIIKQSNSLKRQAAKASRYRELQEELRSRQRRVLSSRLIALDSERGRLARRLAEVHEEWSLSAQHTEAIEEQRNRAALAHEEREEELKRLRETIGQKELQRERLRSRLEQALQQARLLDARIAEAHEEVGGLAQHLSSLEEEARSKSEQTVGLRTEWVAAQEAVTRVAERQSQFGAELAAREAELETCRQELLRAAERTSDFRNQLVKAEERVASVDRQIARSELEQRNVEASYLRSTSELEALKAEYGRREAELGNWAQAVVEAGAALEDTRQKESTLRSEADTLSRETAQATARKQALEESLARHAYSTESVRRLLAQPTRGNSFHPLGVVADFLEVAPGYEAIVEEFLKAELDCVVVGRHEEARSGIKLLENEGSGRSAFFVRDFPAPQNVFRDSEAAEARQQASVMAPLEELVRFQPGLGLNGDIAFPILANSFVVEDAAAAERLAAAYPSCHFVTQKGEHYHHRLVAGGKISSAGPLALRRDFRELERRSAEFQTTLAAKEALWAEVRGRLSHLEAEQRRVATEQLATEKQLVLAREKLRQVEEAVAHDRERISLLDRETASFGMEREETLERRDALQTELDAARQGQTAIEQQLGLATERARRLRMELDQVNRELTEAEVRSSALDERWKAAKAEDTRAAAEAEKAREHLQRLHNQSEAWRGERTRLAAEAENINILVAEASREEEQMREQVRVKSEEAEAARYRRDELSPAVEDARTTLEALREKRSKAELALARAESDSDHHARLCREELGAEPEVLRAEMPADVLLEDEALSTAEGELRELKERLERLGPVNMMALEELQEAQERLSFLEAQRQDLLASINDTTQTIGEIDVASNSKFSDAFKAINGFFAETFRALFGGGTGEMRLGDERDLESGIDLVVQPPGKRLQNVLLLSGGEKALTALALLLAIFRFSPSPFCILDEVDAPLDEPNVVRFTRMIQQMSSQTQFILVTHNKRTMEICPVLYGVTMEEPGVSKLVSVRFEAKEPDPVAVPA